MATGKLMGWIDCAECGAESPVRENKNKKLFYVCPFCGLIYPNMQEGQKKIRARFRPVDENGNAMPPAEAKPDNAPPPSDVPPAAPEKPAPKKSRVLDLLP